MNFSFIIFYNITVYKINCGDKSRKQMGEPGAADGGVGALLTLGIYFSLTIRAVIFKAGG